MRNWSVGRNPLSEICLLDDSVSQRHAQIIEHDGILTIRDLNSRNGTFVNGMRVEYSNLNDGDIISFGECQCRLKTGSLEVMPTKRTIAVLIESKNKSRTPRWLYIGAVVLTIAGILGGCIALFATKYLSGEKEFSIEKVTRATVYIEASDHSGSPCWSGSGVSVLDGKHILTNAHVARAGQEDESELQACTNLKVGITESAARKPSKFFTAKIVTIETAIDLALLEVDIPVGEELPVLAIDYSELNLDAQIRVVGYPGIGGETVTLTSGVIAGIDHSSGARFYKVSAKISHGNSGGPVVNNHGRIIGIATAGYAANVECPTKDTCSVLDESIGLVRPIVFARGVLSRIGK